MKLTTKRAHFCLLIAGLLMFSCTKDISDETVKQDIELKRLLSNAAPSGDYRFYIVPTDDELEKVPQDPRNKLTEVKVELGKLLFYETGIALDARYPEGIGTYSCASCHIPEAGFRPGSAQGVADGGRGFGFNGESRLKNSLYKENEIDVQSARPLVLINVAHVTNTMWNGSFGAQGVNIGTEEVWKLDKGTERNNLGYEALETQNFEGIIVHRLTTDKNIVQRLGYKNLYDQAFPELDEDQRYSQLATTLAMSAFIRAINSSKAPFQSWLKGDHDALSAQEKEGMSIFFGKARCNNCHYEKNLGSMEFHALGVKDMYQRPSFNTSHTDLRNLGRGGFTLKEEDNYKFRVPQLYNMSDAAFFFHGASKNTLEDVIDYKIAARTENPNVSQNILSEKFRPIELSISERASLLAFLKNGLRDPDLLRYKPKELMSGNCFPNNDHQSRIDLGCL